MSTEDRWQPVPVPHGDGRHDIGDDMRAAIVERLTDDWSRDPDLTPEKVRQLAMWAGASVRALLHELGTLRDMDAPPDSPAADAVGARDATAPGAPSRRETEPDPPHLRDDYREVWLSGWRAGVTEQDALIQQLQEQLKENAMNEIPRRSRLDKLFPAELALWNAVQAIESLPADPRLTDAVVLLQSARECVADYFDKFQSPPQVAKGPR